MRIIYTDEKWPEIGIECDCGERFATSPIGEQNCVLLDGALRPECPKCLKNWRTFPEACPVCKHSLDPANINSETGWVDFPMSCPVCHWHQHCCEGHGVWAAENWERIRVTPCGAD